MTQSHAVGSSSSPVSSLYAPKSCSASRNLSPHSPQPSSEPDAFIVDSSSRRSVWIL